LTALKIHSHSNLRIKMWHTWFDVKDANHH